MERELVEFACPEELPARELWGGRAKVLSGDPAAGNGAALVELDGAWQPPAHPFELVVLEGEVGGLGPESWVAVAAGDEAPPLQPAGRALVFVDVFPEAGPSGVVPAGEEGWSESPIEGPDMGLRIKVLRGDPETGPFAFLLRVPPDQTEPRTEWHDCSEQCLILDGELWHDRANGGAGGTMTRHCYFWRPPRVLHSPMGSGAAGVSMYMTVDARLVNHYVEVEGLPPSA